MLLEYTGERKYYINSINNKNNNNKKTSTSQFYKMKSFQNSMDCQLRNILSVQRESTLYYFPGEPEIREDHRSGSLDNAYITSWPPQRSTANYVPCQLALIVAVFFYSHYTPPGTANFVFIQQQYVTLRA